MDLQVRDIRILQLIHQGKSKQEIADEPDINISKARVQQLFNSYEEEGLIISPFKKGVVWKKAGPKVTLTRKGKEILRREDLLKEREDTVSVEHSEIHYHGTQTCHEQRAV